MSKKPEMFSAKFTFTQDADSCEGGDLQQLEVEVDDAGGGKFFVIKTDCWAFDSIADLVALLEKIRSAFGKEWDA